MDWISTYDSSSLVRLGPICEDDNGTKWWLLRVTGTVSPPSYHFSISNFQHWLCFLQIPKNLIHIILFSHKSRLALLSKIWSFKELWRLPLATCCFNCSTNAITGRFTTACSKKHPFSTNTKIMLMGTQIHKVLVVFVLSSTIVREVN